MNGQLGSFPTSAGHTSFTGQASGTGTLTGLSGGNVYTASFTHVTMPVSGWVEYGEPAFPLCPLIGSASNNTIHGHITVGSSSMPSTTGVVYRAGSTLTGVVTGVVYQFDLTYTRVGPAATILFGVEPGHAAYATVYFTTPGQGAGQFTVPIVAAGEAVFQADFVQAGMNCSRGAGHPLNRPIAYQLHGVVNGAAA